MEHYDFLYDHEVTRFKTHLLSVMKGLKQFVIVSLQDQEIDEKYMKELLYFYLQFIEEYNNENREVNGRDMFLKTMYDGETLVFCKK